MSETTLANGQRYEVGRMTVAHTGVVCTTASVTLLAANTARAYALLINDTASDIYINITGATAVAHTGILLLANGGAYEMGAAWGNLTDSAITGINVSASALKVLVTEGTGV